VELEAKRMPCSWKTKEEMAQANLMESKQAKVGPTIVIDEDRSLGNRIAGMYWVSLIVGSL
jgi:hypothetical protein